MTKIYLLLRPTGVMEVVPASDERFRLWYQGGGFDVYVKGSLKASGLTRQQVSHAALVAVQASGGKTSHLRDVRVGNCSPKSKKNDTEKYEGRLI